MKKEVIRRCLICAGQLQEAGISCKMMESSGGSTGECPGCHKRKLCFNWEVERRERFTSSALRVPSPQGEGYKEGD